MHFMLFCGHGQREFKSEFGIFRYWWSQGLKSHSFPCINSSADERSYTMQQCSEMTNTRLFYYVNINMFMQIGTYFVPENKIYLIFKLHLDSNTPIAENTCDLHERP
jgi:hypothetical protein